MDPNEKDILDKFKEINSYFLKDIVTKHDKEKAFDLSRKYEHIFDDPEIYYDYSNGPFFKLKIDSKWFFLMSLYEEQEMEEKLNSLEAYNSDDEVQEYLCQGDPQIPGVFDLCDYFKKNNYQEYRCPKCKAIYTYCSPDHLDDEMCKYCRKDKVEKLLKKMDEQSKNIMQFLDNNKASKVIIGKNTYFRPKYSYLYLTKKNIESPNVKENFNEDNFNEDKLNEDNYYIEVDI